MNKSLSSYLSSCLKVSLRRAPNSSASRVPELSVSDFWKRVRRRSVDPSFSEEAINEGKGLLCLE